MNIGKGGGSLAAEDILSVAALWVVVLIALGIVFHGVDATIGGGIIAALAGAAGVVKLIKSKRQGSEVSNTNPHNY